MGVDGFGTVLDGLRTYPGFFDNVKSILLVADNDEDPAISFEKVCTQILKAPGYGVPGQPMEPCKSQDSLPQITVLMIPWEGKSGCLETLCLPAMRDRLPSIKKCFDEYATCARVELSSCAQYRLDKLELRILLSTHHWKNPLLSLASAWDPKIDNPIPLDHNGFENIKQFLTDFE